MENIKAAIFDLDGTVLDSMWVWTEIDKRFLGDRNLEVPADYLEAIAPLGARKAAEYTIERFGLNEKVEDIMGEWFDMAMGAYENEVQCKPFVIKYLNQLKTKGIKLAVATSSDRKLIIPALKRNRIIDMFDAIITVDQVERGKGFPDIYEKAARDVGVSDNSQCIVYEDILAGIKGARMGGFKTVGVYEDHSSYEHPEMKKLSDRFIMSFKELLD
ncbi:MAG: HAD family phosphatase [Lachnospiraceae bacterium]|nr:HAD family phosphatase [Lachnospiraceae bacterium]